MSEEWSDDICEKCGKVGGVFAVIEKNEVICLRCYNPRARANKYWLGESASFSSEEWKKLSDDWKCNNSKEYNDKWNQVPIYDNPKDKSK